jgi:serine phosphatase RsbU (regulator of sigma subunit)
MEGQRFLEALRSDAEFARVPVIVVSAVDDLDVLTQWLELGADDYLPTAFRPVMLRARLRAALDRARLRDAESLTREMAVARNIQRDFLPESLPVARGVQLEAALHPARQVSGDFYDAFMLAPSGNIVLVVGDVCDKGVGAALFMALFRSLIRASADPVGGGAIQMIGGRRTLVRQSLEAATPADLLTRVAGFTNDYIARLHGRTNMFATVFLAALTPTTGQFDYVNAGHEPAIVLAPDGATWELRPTGPALGLLPDRTFGAGEGTLESGDCLFAFTDGLVEARSPAGEAFGSERLRDALRANTTVPSSLVGGVLEALRAFTGPAEPHDDVTVLAATRTMG